MRLIDLRYPTVTAERYGISVRTAAKLRDEHPNGMPEAGLKIIIADIKRRSEAKRARTLRELGMYSRVPGTIRKK
jgi:hypothetical protein